MQHSAIVKKNDVAIVFTKTNTDMPEIKCWKLNSDNVFSLIENINFVVYKLTDGYYKCGFTTPNEDCYICIKFGNDVSFLRVGNPETKVLHHSDSNDELVLNQIDASDGNVIASLDLIKLSDGFYYKEIKSQTYSLIEIKDKNNSFRTVSVLKLPYPSDQESQPVTSGYSALSNFVEIEKLAMIGFLGERNSGFDRALGKWVSKSSPATASDISSAIAHRYGLSISKTDNEEKWIGNYVKYIKTQAASGNALVYRPGSTPDNNKNNFELIGDDIQGNTIVKGLAIYVMRPLEKIQNTEGAVISFRNKE